MSVIFAIFLFSVLIFVHELGHFLAAKKMGVQVNEFAFGMGPTIWKKQRGETLHSISQMYGIRLKSLCNINRRSRDSQVTEGQQIRLM